jgi:hypothetical protein
VVDCVEKCRHAYPFLPVSLLHSCAVILSVRHADPADFFMVCMECRLIV